MKWLKWLLNSWWGRLFILVQTACLIITIYLAINFIIHSHQEEDSDIAATLHAEDVSRDFGETIQPPDTEHRFEKDIDRIKKKSSEERLRIPTYYLLTNLAFPAIWCIGLFICKGLPVKPPTAAK
jgi:hypothetical protein